MKVCWDTNLFIYLFEEHADLTAQTVRLWTRMRRRGDTLAVSSLGLGELLAGYARRNVPGDTFERRLRGVAEVIPFDIPAARQFGLIRADRTIAPADAIHLACASAGGVDLFVTNDERLARKVVPGAPILTSLAQVPI